MLNKIKKEIDKARNIILSAHIFADGDAIGSLMALKYLIEKYDNSKKVEIVLQDDIPKFCNNFPETKCIKSENPFDEIDLVIQLDTANIERAALDNNIYNLAKQTINIDHHVSNIKYLNINYIEDVSSTAEIIYDFAKILNVEIDEQIAKYIYLGIINDTGNFRHSNVTEKTFLIAANLRKLGINITEINSGLFYKSLSKSRIFGDVLLNFKYYAKYKFAYYYLSKEKMLELNVDKFDADGISELLLSIENVDVALYNRYEDAKYIKGSFRSKKINVNKIASNFNGGGHILAAGFKTELSEKEILDKVLKELGENKND